MKRELSQARAFFIPSLVVVLLGLPESGLPAERGRVFLPQDDAAQSLYRDMEESIARGEWDRVAARWRAVLGFVGSEKPMAPVQVSPGRALSFWEAFGNQILDRIPEENRREIVSQTRQALDSLWRRTEEDKGARLDLVKRIARDFPRYPRFPDACLELARRALEAGDMASAFDWAQDVLDQVGTGEDRPPWTAVQALAIVAEAGDRIGEIEASSKARKAMASRAGGLPREVQEQVTAFLSARPSLAAPGRILPFTREVFPALRLGDALWFVSLGRPAPPRAADWIVPVEPKARAVPSVPAFLDGRIYVIHEREIRSIDIDSGKDRWVAPLPGDARPSNSLLHVPVPGRGTVLACVRDSIRAYVESDTEGGTVTWERTAVYDPEGKDLLWRTSREGPGKMEEDAGEEGKEGDPGRPVQASVTLSSPHVAGSLAVLGIVARVEKEMVVFVAGIDIASGHPRWTARLGSAQGSDLLGLGAAPSPPAVRGTVAYHLSNVGLVGAVDLRDGSVRWISQYPGLSTFGKVDAIRREDRWTLNPVLVTRDAVVVAPQDSNLLLGFHPRTGDALWHAHRDGRSYLLGLHGSRATAITTGRGIDAFHTSGPSGGTRAWSWEPPEGFHPEGRGCIKGDTVYLPGQEGLYAVDARDGSPIHFTFWEQPGSGANILVLEKGFVLQGMTHVSFFGRRPGDPPGSVEAADRAELLRRVGHHWRGGDFAAGMPFLSAWRGKTEREGISPEEDTTRHHLSRILDAWLAMEKDDGEPDRRIAMMRARRDLSRNETQEVRFSIDLAQTLEETGDPAQAFQEYHRILLRGVRTDHFLTDLLSVDSKLYVRRRIEELIRRLPGIYRPIEEKARAELARARRERRTGAYSGLIRDYPFSEAARTAHFELAEIHAGARDFARARATLSSFLDDHPHAPERARAMVLLVSLLKEEGLSAEAERILRRLGTEFAGKVIEIDGVPMPVEEYVRERLSAAGREAGPAKLRLPFARAWQTRTDLVNQVTSQVEIITPTGSPPVSLSGTFLVRTRRGIQCRDLGTGFERWAYTLEPGLSSIDPEDALVGPRLHYFWDSEVLFSGGNIVIRDDRQVVAVDAATGSMAWRYAAPPREAEKPRGSPLLWARARIAGATGDSERIYISTYDRSLVCVDSRNGRILFELRLDFEPWRDPILWGDEVLIFRGSPAEAEQPVLVHFFSATTGMPTGSFRPPSTMRYPRLHTNVKPIRTDQGVVLTVGQSGVILLDPEERKERWFLRELPFPIQGIRYFPDRAGKLYILPHPGKGRPCLVGMDLATGRIDWVKDFPQETAVNEITVDGPWVYALIGDLVRHIVALEVQGNRGEFLVSERWRQPIGHSFFSSNRIFVTEDAVIVPSRDSDTVRLFDRRRGARILRPARELEEFLQGKGLSSAAVVGDTFVVLTNRGDAAFRRESMDPPDPLALELYAHPESAFTRQMLALKFLERGDFSRAMTLLEEGILQEGVPGEDSTPLYFLLDGIKEAAMGLAPPIVRCPYLSVPPIVDGDLDDPWDIALRIPIRGPRFVSPIQAPGRMAPEWKGEEDLSAYLYTGWDEENFYFALDVDDNSIQPYVRDREDWVGDCLLIGIDPRNDGGYRSRPDDQLMTLALAVPRQGKKGEEKETEPPGKYHVQKKDDDSGVVYEVGIPWSTLQEGLQAGGPRPGLQFGLSLVLTDDDSPAQSQSGKRATKTLSLNPCHLLHHRTSRIWVAFTPEYFPKVTLEGAPRSR